MLFQPKTTDSDSLKDYLIKTASEGLKILRQPDETDEAYIERFIKIERQASKVLGLFDDETWDSGSVIDALTISLAGVVSTNYEDVSETVDPYVSTVLADRIRYYRGSLGQDSTEPSDDEVREFIEKFQLVDRPIGKGESEKLEYARRVMRTTKTIRSALVAANATDFDAIEALSVMLSTIFEKSPLPVDMIEFLVHRILENSKKDDD